MKLRKIAVIATTSVASAMVLLSGFMKLTKNPEIVATLTKVGVADYLLPLALMEIGFTILFIYSKTSRIGFILLSCYFSGALATELSHGTPFNAVLPMALIWIAALVREPSIFWLTSPTKVVEV